MQTDTLQRLAERIIAISPADQTQVNLSVSKQAFSRFNENRIHQNLVRNLNSLSIRVVVNNRIGSVTVADLDCQNAEAALAEAIAAARLQPKNSDFVSLPTPSQPPKVQAMDHKLADFSPMDRAEKIGQVIDYARSRGLSSSGTFSIESGHAVVANSLGVRVNSPYVRGFFRTIMNNGNCTGYADEVITDICSFNPRKLAQVAADKALICNEPYRIEPGKYTVLLEPTAVADLLRFLGAYTFSGQAVQDGRSYLKEHMGLRIMDSRISIYDDANHRLSQSLPFDNEGVTRQRVDLIENGIAKGAVYDSFTAYKHKLKSTGHAGKYGPAPAHMVMSGGNSQKDEMIARIDKGILITRFHYTSCPEPMKAIATGTSRDGTFLIENGKIARRINNVRFTQSVIEAFDSVIDISRERRPARDWWSSFISLVPTLSINSFNITGTTTF